MNSVLAPAPNPLPGAQTERKPVPTIEERSTEELVIAVVGPIASGCSKVVDVLESISETSTRTRYRVTN